MSNETDTNSSSSANGTGSYCQDPSEFSCYNIVDTNQLITSIWLSIAGGCAVLVLFIILRNIEGWRRIYHKRSTQISDLLYRPPPLSRASWIDRIASFLGHVFRIKDVDLFLSSGIDSLMMVRINTLGMQLFFPLSIVGLSVLLPLYRSSTNLESASTNVDSIMLFTMANVASKENTLWAPLVLFWLFTLYSIWAIYWHVCSYAAFRSFYTYHLELTGPLGLAPGALPRVLIADISHSYGLDSRMWRRVLALLSPMWMHHEDLRFVKLCKEAYKKAFLAADQGTLVDEESHSNYFRSFAQSPGILEQVYPYWTPPEDVPSQVSSIHKPGGMLLGKSNWALRKRCLGHLPCTGNVCWAQICEYVVQYRDAGVARTSTEVTDAALAITVAHERSSSFAFDSGMKQSRLKYLERELSYLFPDTFLKLVPVYLYQDVDELLSKWDKTVAKINALEARKRSNIASLRDFNHESDIETSFKCSECLQPAKRKLKRLKKIEKDLETLLQEKANLEEDIGKQRKVALSEPYDTAAFAIFSNQADARAALNGQISIIPEINMIAGPAPGPDEINFQALLSTSIQQRRTLIFMLPVYVLLMVFPIGAITGALSNLTVAVCGGTPETNKLYWSAYCDSAGKIPLTLLTSIVPVALSAFWDTFVMPLTLYMSTQRLRTHTSFTSLDRAITIQLYVFSAFNTFFLGVLGGAALSQIGTAISQNEVIGLLGESLPGASNFFLNYVAVHTFFTNFFRFCWPHDGTVLFQLLRMLKLANEPFSDREAWIIRSTPSFRSARHYASFLLIFIIGLSYSVISPFVLPLCWGFFVSSWIAWKYNCIHFYEPCYCSLGEMWRMFYNCYIATLGVATFFVTCILISKGFFWQAGLMAIVNVIILCIGCSFIHHKVTKFARATPLQMAKSAPIITSSIEEVELLYTPSCLRPGAIGWFPEEGKIWEKYGLPKFVGPNASKQRRRK